MQNLLFALLKEYYKSIFKSNRGGGKMESGKFIFSDGEISKNLNYLNTQLLQIKATKISVLYNVKTMKICKE